MIRPEIKKHFKCRVVDYSESNLLVRNLVWEMIGKSM